MWFGFYSPHTITSQVRGHRVCRPLGFLLNFCPDRLHSSVLGQQAHWAHREYPASASSTVLNSTLVFLAWDAGTGTRLHEILGALCCSPHLLCLDFLRTEMGVVLLTPSSYRLVNSGREQQPCTSLCCPWHISLNKHLCLGRWRPKWH